MKILQLKEEFAVIKVVFNNENITFNYTKVTKHKNDNLEIDSTEIYATSSVTDLKKKVKDLPVIISFLGDNILYTINNNLFNSSEESFYSTQYINNKEERFLALIRRNIVDTIVNDFVVNNFFVLDICIGVLTFNLLYETTLLKSEVLIDDIELIFNEGDLVEVNLTKQKNIENKELYTEEEILILSLVLNFVYPSEKIINTYQNEKFNKNKEDLKEKLLFTFISKYGTLLLFVIIISGYFLGTFFTYKNNSLKAELNVGVNKRKKLFKLEEKEKRKREMLQISGFYKNNLASFYINEIIKTTPVSVQISGLEVYKADEKPKKEKKIKINDRMIIVKGVFTKGDAFNKWIYEIKENINIETINITKFKKTKRTTFFELEVSLK